jgi:preprotein translocase subunit SecG
MMSTDILAVSLGQGLVATLFVLVCALLILVILLQKGRGGGLSGAFGGVGGHSAFGAKTGDVFTWITVGLTALFIFMAVLGNWTFVPRAATPTPVVSAPQTPAPGGANTPGQKPAEKPAGAQTTRPS